MPRPRPGAEPLGAGQVLVALLVCLGLWTLVDSPALLHNAEAGPRGARRTAAIDLLKPVDRAAAASASTGWCGSSDELIGRAPPRPPTTPAPVAIESLPPPISGAAAACRPAPPPARPSHVGDRLP